jgi:ectoine hydroxylase-related dioxygenase (phytanoyl-CoA dioxygenase family)
MRQLLSDIENDRQFKQEGYVKLNLLTPAQLEELKTLAGSAGFAFENNVNRERCSYNTSLFETDENKRIAFFNAVAEKLQPVLDKILIDFDVAMVNYWSKDLNDGAVEIHQNWSHVDETKFRSMSLWIPLQDTDHTNGTIEVVPQSQGKYDLLRGINIFNPLLDIAAEVVEKDMLPINLKAGEAILFDDSLVHYTAPNKSNQPRVAVQLVVKPKEAQALFSFRWLDKTENNIEIFDATPPFFSRLQTKSAFTGRPDFGKSLGFTTYHNSPLSYQDFKNALQVPQAAL